MDLSQSVELVKGIGPKTAAVLEKAGIRTLRDLLYFFPRNYENYQTAVPIENVRPGKVMLRAKLESIKSRPTRRRNFTITEGIISDDTGVMRVTWFNQAYRAKQMQIGAYYYFTGSYDFKYNHYQLTNPAVAMAKEVDSKDAAYQPIYSARYSLKPQFFKKVVAGLRKSFVNIPDLLPMPGGPSFLKPGARSEALFNMHFPDNAKDTERAREYLAYEELFEFLLAARLNQQENQKLKAASLPFDATKTKKLVGSLPFKLTDAQRIATWDILRDMEKTVPMNRLLQGDVGSGKTVVAAIAAHQAAENGFQTAILAPTAILATQHAESFKKLLEPLGVKVCLLTAATKHKAELKKQIASGEIDIIIGTHALLTDDTVFHKLGFCVIDEQHRFGVAQRQKLLMKTAITTPGFAPHLLAMTATPIPRSLQLTVFGDLDISVLDSLPKGRQPINTKILRELDMQESLYPALKEHLASGEQVYWICRLIEDGPSEAASVKKMAKKVAALFPKYQVEFLHGKMKPEEKDAVMEKFLKNQVQILVSTTVVEVGVDVPNATQIVIMDAEGYGLAQLHQLRGRVGRGTKRSSCFLITTGEGQPSRRLRELEKSTDGFHLAEVDLKLRGPGEIYGSLQHGELNLQIATLADTKLISLARKQVDVFTKELANQPELMLKYKELNNEIKKYQQLTTLN